MNNGLVKNHKVFIIKDILFIEQIFTTVIPRRWDGARLGGIFTDN